MGTLILLIVIGLVIYFNLEKISPFFEEIYKHYQVVFCNHVYEREIDEKGYQYCTMCNVAKYIGRPECAHQWEVLEKYKVTDSISKTAFKYVYVQKCVKCGKMNNHET